MWIFFFHCDIYLNVSATTSALTQISPLSAIATTNRTQRVWIKNSARCRLRNFTVYRPAAAGGVQYNSSRYETRRVSCEQRREGFSPSSSRDRLSTHRPAASLTQISPLSSIVYRLSSIGQALHYIIYDSKACQLADSLVKSHYFNSSSRVKERIFPHGNRPSLYTLLMWVG